MTSVRIIKGDASLPRVSIIIPFNKDRGYLDQAIASIELQSYEGEIEIIISFSRNHTVGYNLNRGIERATGKYVKYLCDDDYLTIDCIYQCVGFMERTRCSWMHADSFIIWENKPATIQRPVITNPTFKNMLYSNVIHGGTLMYKRIIFTTVGMFDEELKTAEEYEFNLRLFSINQLPGYLPAVVYNYRRHSQQKSLGIKDAAYQQWRASVVKQIQSRYER